MRIRVAKLFPTPHGLKLQKPTRGNGKEQTKKGRYEKKRSLIEVEGQPLFLFSQSQMWLWFYCHTCFIRNEKSVKYVSDKIFVGRGLVAPIYFYLRHLTIFILFLADYARDSGYTKYHRWKKSNIDQSNLPLFVHLQTPTPTPTPPPPPPPTPNPVLFFFMLCLCIHRSSLLLLHKSSRANNTFILCDSHYNSLIPPSFESAAALLNNKICLVQVST